MVKEYTFRGSGSDCFGPFSKGPTLQTELAPIREYFFPVRVDTILEGYDFQGHKHGFPLQKYEKKNIFMYPYTVYLNLKPYCERRSIIKSDLDISVIAGH